ncbi:MAG: cation transporter [Bacteroidetes bacterium]|nr:cation transporter [Bacteroidota bacterium]
MQRWIVITACVLFLLKIVAWYLTKSVAILTDALESIVNIIASFIGIYSLYISAKPRDENHPYGHGKAEFLSAAIEGILIMLAGVFIIYESVIHLVYPHPLKKLDFGIILVAISAVINFILGYIAIKRGIKNKSAVLEASGHHLQSDTYSTIAIIVGLILIYYTGFHQLDSIVAIILSFIIIFVGYRITRKSIAGIMDEADKKILGRLVELLNQYRTQNWIDIHNLRVIKFGSVLHVDCHLTVPWYLNVRESNMEIENLTQYIENEFGETMEFFVHADDCVEFSCPICLKEDCSVRLHPFKKRIEWTLENIIPNNKHQL